MVARNLQEHVSGNCTSTCSTSVLQTESGEVYESHCYQNSSYFTDVWNVRTLKSLLQQTTRSIKAQGALRQTAGTVR